VAPVGRCTPLRSKAIYVDVGDGSIDWIRYDIDELLLGQTAGLLILQGLSLGKLFEGVSFSSPDFLLEGTFVFLAGKLSDLTLPPLALRGITLGSITTIAGELTKEQVLGALLQDVLPINPAR
jgi:hypothetical protein